MAHMPARRGAAKVRRKMKARIKVVQSEPSGRFGLYLSCGIGTVSWPRQGLTQAKRLPYRTGLPQDLMKPGFHRFRRASHSVPPLLFPAEPDRPTSGRSDRRLFPMSRRCELTGKAVQSGNLVSHSNRKTRTRFLPNLCNVTLISDSLGRSVRLRVAAAALRSVEHRGGLDAFLLKAREDDLSTNARALKREIAKKAAEASA